MSLATPEGSLAMGLAVGVVSYTVFTTHLPPVVDIRTVDSCNSDVHSANKQAAWMSAAATAGIALIAKDATVFILGGAVTLALYWTYAHANIVSPLTGRATGTMMITDIVSAQQDSMPNTHQWDVVI